MLVPMHRRQFIHRLADATTAGGLLMMARAGGAETPAAAGEGFKSMRLSLSCGSIGVKASQTEAMGLAKRHGFDAVEPYLSYISELTPEQTADLVADLRAKSLVWGCAGLPVEFRRDDSQFRKDLDQLPQLARAGQRADVVCVGTWISPGHPTMTYVQNFRQHASRLREVAVILKDHGQRLGLEYVGTKTSRASAKHPFIHSLAETQDLIAEIGTGNVGIVLDTWHWWQADDTEAEIRSLRAVDVVAVDLNDAPAGVAKDQQRDNRRELPAATGVIGVRAFLEALQAIGYSGPLRAEPFNQTLNDLEDEAACAAAIGALRKAVGRS
jgi:sugar phosphate isomerase/epimerase